MEIAFFTTVAQVVVAMGGEKTSRWTRIDGLYDGGKLLSWRAYTHAAHILYVCIIQLNAGRIPINRSGR